MDIPEQGQLVEVRGRYWVVQDVVSHAPEPSAQALHKVSLECLDDDGLGESAEVIWELEVGPKVQTGVGLPEVTDRWDTPDRLRAFLRALAWSSPSVVEGPPLYAPFRAAVEEEPYQLEPVVRALEMPRVSLLLADSVGLGKSVEAGLVLMELIARQRVRKVLVLCPASLQRQWQEELRSKFALDFHILDRDETIRLRREYGVHLNPWSSVPRLITSLDYLKQEAVLAQFMASAERRDGGALRDWDLLILDEAHNTAPSGSGAYIRDSDRTRLVKRLAPCFEHRLFLTATPHNGHTVSFTALLEMLDPLRFSRGPTVDRAQIRTVMVRRMKEEIKDALGAPKFIPRLPIEALRIPMPKGPDDPERRLFDLLEAYTGSRLARAGAREALPFRFTFTLLKKRLLSSPAAFASTLEAHLENISSPSRSTSEDQPDEALVRDLQGRAREDWADDGEKSQCEVQAIEESARFFGELTPEEDRILCELQTLSASYRARRDRKADVLLSWIQKHLAPSGRWNSERLIIFTEYLDTLEYLKGILEGLPWMEEGRLITLIGGMRQSERERIKKAFQRCPEESPARILLATDAASEGLNLQNFCRYLIHVEIPWNPNKLEQRNGRIDRHGQKREVAIFHFAYDDHADSAFLEVVARKVEKIRDELGSVGEVIERQIEKAFLAGRTEVEALLQQKEPLDLPEDRRRRVHQELKADIDLESRVREIRAQLQRSRDKMDLTPESLKSVLHEALILVDPARPGLEPAKGEELAGKAWFLKDLPPPWADCDASLHDERGRRLNVTFEPEFTRDREDVTLLHLNHPLMHRAISAFRANLWPPVDHRKEHLQRVSFRILRGYDLGDPVVVAYGRLVVTSRFGHRLHEAIIKVGGTIAEGKVLQLPTADLEHLLSHGGADSRLPHTVGDRLRSLYRAHRRTLEGFLETEEKSERVRIGTLLKKKGADESKAVAALLRERMKELEARIKELDHPLARQQFLPFGTDLETINQYEDDLKWLHQRKATLAERLESEPESVRGQYEVKAVRAFPVALEYLLPESYARGV